VVEIFLFYVWCMKSLSVSGILFPFIVCIRSDSVCALSLQFIKCVYPVPLIIMFFY
jgi:hypothetical protein